MAELTTADEMHDFESIAIFYSGVSPSWSRNDLAIQFHGDTIRLHPQVFQKGLQRHCIGKIAGFAVDLKFHPKEFSQAKG